MLPPEHTFHIFGESIQEDTVDESTSSMDLMLAFPLVVHVSRVQSLNNHHIQIHKQHQKTSQIGTFNQYSSNKYQPKF